MTGESLPGPLEGLRVIELCGERGAWAGKLFADAGAEVIKVEPLEGDETRAFAPFLDDVPGPERSLVFWHSNTSKLGVTLDLGRETDRALLRRLVAGADVFLESQDPGVLAAMGLDYPDLRPSNPGLIMVSITPFGRSGPRSHEPATDLTIIAGGGPAWNNGYDDHSLPPVRGGGNQGYQTGCHYAFMSALAAILHRDAGGPGQHIDVSMHAAANVTTESGTFQWLVAGATVQRQTGRHAATFPTQLTQILCADGRYACTGLIPKDPKRYGALHAWLTDIGLVDDFPLAPLLEMGAAKDRIDISLLETDAELQAILGAGREGFEFIASRLPAYEFFLRGQERGFQVGIIYSPEEIFDDPHFKARGFPVEVEHPELGRTFTYPGAPYHLHASPWRIRSRAPLLGEHNDQVLGPLRA